MSILRRFIGTVCNLPSAAISTAAEAYTLRASGRCGLMGFDVRQKMEGDRAQENLERLEKALILIRNAEPRLLSRMSRTFRHLHVRPGGSAYWPSTQTCVIDAKLLSDAFPPFVIAATIVHEYVHARLYRRWWRYDQAMLERIERRCTIEQIRFATTQAGTARYIEWLQHQRDAPAVTRAAMFERRVQAMEELQLPRAFVKLYKLLFKPRGRHHAGP